MHFKHMWDIKLGSDFSEYCTTLPNIADMSAAGPGAGREAAESWGWGGGGQPAEVTRQLYQEVEIL